MRSLAFLFAFASLLSSAPLLAADKCQADVAAAAAQVAAMTDQTSADKARSLLAAAKKLCAADSRFEAGKKIKAALALVPQSSADVAQRP